MDPFLEKNPIFHELHTQILAEAQAQLQPQIRPKYVARLERYLSEGSVWNQEGMISLEGKEPDLTLASAAVDAPLGQDRLRFLRRLPLMQPKSLSRKRSSCASKGVLSFTSIHVHGRRLPASSC